MENIKNYILNKIKIGSSVFISGHIDNDGVSYDNYHIDDLIVTNMKVSKVQSSYSINFKGNDLRLEHLEIIQIYNMLYNLHNEENYELYGIEFDDIKSKKQQIPGFVKESSEVMTDKQTRTRKTKKDVATE